MVLTTGLMACVPRGRLITDKLRWYNSLQTRKKMKGNMKKEDTITLKIAGANTGQLQALCIDLALSLKPWARYVKIKILKGKKSFKLQAPRISLIDFVKNKKQQAAGSKLDSARDLG